MKDKRAVDLIIETENVDNLFESHSVDEIEDIVSKLKEDIERKKYDMQQIVGEKYKDLVDVYDCLHLMEERCSYIINCLNQLNDLSKRSKSFYALKATDTNDDHFTEKIASLKCQLIVKTPSIIWSNIDQDDVLSAVYFYALAVNVWQSLESLTFSKDKTVRQYADLVKSFKESLSLHVWQSVKFTESYSLEAKEVALKLICASCLENISVENLLQKLFADRTNQICNFNVSSHELKFCFEFFSGIIHDTLRLTFCIFLEDNDVSSVFQRTGLFVRRFKPQNQTLQKYINSRQINSSAVSCITNFELNLAHISENIYSTQLLAMCKNWLSQIKETIQEKIKISLKDVVAFDKVFHAVNRIDRTINRPEKGITWQDINETLLEGNINLWEYFLRDIVIHYLKVLIRNNLDSAFSTLGPDTISKLSMITHQNALDLVWTEDASLPASISSKAYRIYDEYVQIVSDFEKKLENAKNQLSVIQVKAQVRSIMSSEDLADLRDFFVKYLRENVDSLMQRLNSAVDSDDSYVLLNLADFCRTLMFSSPNFKNCHLIFGGNNIWIDTKSDLQKLYASTLTSYLEANLNNSIGTFKQEMTLDPITNIMSIISIWDEIYFEDTQDNAKVPVQISSPLFRFLNSINEVVNQCSAHTTSHNIVSNIVKRSIDLLKDLYFHKYEEITENASFPGPLKQTLLLQFLFDISFLKRLVLSVDNSEEIVPNLKNLLSSYRQTLDPVNLHVLEEHIKKSLDNCLAATFLLFNSIFHNLSSSSSIKTANLDESLISKKHILMPCYSYESHFSLLPLEKDV